MGSRNEENQRREAGWSEGQAQDHGQVDPPTERRSVAHDRRLAGSPRSGSEPQQSGPWSPFGGYSPGEDSVGRGSGWPGAQGSQPGYGRAASGQSFGQETFGSEQMRAAFGQGSEADTSSGRQFGGRPPTAYPPGRIERADPSRAAGTEAAANPGPRSGGRFSSYDYASSQGQYGGSDPYADRAIARGEGNSVVHYDPEYQQWRAEQMRKLDKDYESWRKERYHKFSEDFNTWLSRRKAEGDQSVPDSSPPVDTALRASSSAGAQPAAKGKPMEPAGLEDGFGSTGAGSRPSAGSGAGASAFESGASSGAEKPSSSGGILASLLGTSNSEKRK